jgi:hypothetical protein
LSGPRDRQAWTEDALMALAHALEFLDGPGLVNCDVLGF